MTPEQENEIVRAVFSELDYTLTPMPCVGPVLAAKTDAETRFFNNAIKCAILRGVRRVQGLHYDGTLICKSDQLGQ